MQWVLSFVFLKILFSLRILITTLLPFPPFLLKYWFLKDLRDLDHVSIPLADLNPLLNN